MAEQGWTEVVQAAFASLTPPHLEKKKATIIALVDARLAGRPEESVWHQPGVCNRGTYHLKWKKQPGFAQALAAVDRLAREWKDGRAIRALQDAAERLALAAPIAVAKATALMASADEAIVLRAAFGILDRAGVETATKSSTAAEVKHDVEFSLDRLDDAELEALARIAGRFAGDPGGAGETPAD